jgi:predicted DNA-binding protein
VKKVSPKTGRPKLQDPIRCQITVRLKQETMKRLEKYSNAHGITKGEAVRKSVEQMLNKENS